MDNNTGLSVLIIARNEEERIKACINSIQWAQEIIVLDNGSKDNTSAIAKGLGATVLKIEGMDFSKMRDTLLKSATKNWILYLDADEQISSELSLEIQEKINKFTSNETRVYKIRRQNYYLGQAWPKIERLERLFYRSSLLGWYGKVHESPKYMGKSGELNSLMYHFTHRSLTEMVSKTNEWSTIESKLRYDSNHPPMVWWRFFRVMLTAFIQSYINDGGWRVGTIGLIESAYQAFSLFITYAKLWELQQSNTK